MEKQRNSTRRAIVASGISLLLCLLMLIGTTLAWFTDQASNLNNRIESGTLKLEVIGYDAQGDQVVDFKNETTPLIENYLWEPGIEDVRFIEVFNKGSLDLKFELFLKGENTKLAEALWFTFVEVDAVGDGAPAPVSERRAMTELFTVGAQGILEALGGDDNKVYRLDFGMNECAGNEYQGLDFMVDIHVVATQTNDKAVINLDPVWPNDGNIIPVFTTEDFRNAMYWVDNGVACPTIILMDNVILNEDWNITKPFNIDFNGKTLLVLGDINIDFANERGTMDFGNKATGGKLFVKGTYNKTQPGIDAFVFNENILPDVALRLFIDFTTDGNPIMIDGGSYGSADLDGANGLKITSTTGYGPYYRMDDTIPTMTDAGFTAIAKIYIDPADIVGVGAIIHFNLRDASSNSNGPAIRFQNVGGNLIAYLGAEPSVAIPGAGEYTIRASIKNVGGRPWYDLSIDEIPGALWSGYIGTWTYAEVTPGSFWFSQIVTTSTVWLKTFELHEN